MTIFIENWSRDLFTLSTVDRIENDTPMRDIDSRVLKEVVKENLESPNRNGLGVTEGRTYVVELQTLALVEGPARFQHLI